MRNKSEYIGVRVTQETVRKIEGLGRRWGPKTKQLSRSDVITEAVARCWDAEEGKGDAGSVSIPPGGLAEWMKGAGR